MEYFSLVDKLRIRYLEQGTGPAVILVHGASLGSSADVWEGTLGSLAEGGYRGLAYDQPGFGHSDNPTDYTVSYRAAFILKFMDVLYGVQDRGSAAKRCALLKEREPGLRVELLENTRHLVMWDAHEIFNQKVLGFLSA